jgi:hypothetical protein
MIRMIYRSLGKYCDRELVLGYVVVLLWTVTLCPTEALERLRRVACHNRADQSTGSDTKPYDT